jgi:hypothetical protein
MVAFFRALRDKAWSTLVTQRLPNAVVLATSRSLWLFIAWSCATAERGAQTALATAEEMLGLLGAAAAPAETKGGRSPAGADDRGRAGLPRLALSSPHVGSAVGVTTDHQLVPCTAGTAAGHGAAPGQGPGPHLRQPCR